MIVNDRAIWTSRRWHRSRLWFEQQLAFLL